MVDAQWTTDEVFEEAARLRDFVRELFCESGGLRATSWLYATRNPKTGAEGKGLVIVPNVGGFDSQGRDMYAYAVRTAGEYAKAMGIVFAAEMWMIEPAYLEEIGLERATKEIAGWVGRIKDHPRRIEGILMNLEHHRLSGHRLWLARITRDQDGKPTLGEWEERLVTSGTGRLLHMLPPVN